MFFRSCCVDDPVGANDVSIEVDDGVYDVQPVYELKATKMSAFLKQKGWIFLYDKFSNSIGGGCVKANCFSVIYAWICKNS